MGIFVVWLECNVDVYRRPKVMTETSWIRGVDEGHSRKDDEADEALCRPVLLITGSMD